MKYLVKQIQEADFGCEERPEGYQPQVFLRLCNETGEESIFEIADAVLREKNIEEGDWVVLDCLGENIAPDEKYFYKCPGYSCDGEM